MAIRESTKYESERGTIHKITLGVATKAAAGTPPEGAIDSDIIAKVSKTNREFGLRPRKVVASRVIGTAPNQCRIYTQVPVLTATQFIGDTYALNATLAVGGEDWVIISKLPEDY